MNGAELPCGAVIKVEPATTGENNNNSNRNGTVGGNNKAARPRITNHDSSSNDDDGDSDGHGHGHYGPSKSIPRTAPVKPATTNDTSVEHSYYGPPASQPSTVGTSRIEEENEEKKADVPAVADNEQEEDLDDFFASL